MSAHFTRTTVAGALGVFLAAAGPAFATPASAPLSNPAINDLDAAALTQTATNDTRPNDLEEAINRWLDGPARTATKRPDNKEKTSSALQFVSLKDAASGKASAFRCKSVRSIRAWSHARRNLLRRG